VSSVGHRTPKILLVDDDPLVVEAMTAYFETVGIDVLTYSSVFEIPFLIGRERPEVVLLDISMPVLDGAKIMQSLAERVRQSTNFILFSGRSRRELAVMTEQLGAVDCISKAEDMASIERRVRYWINAAQSHTA
jgi:two-component system OmpR family response regulator